MIYYPDCMYPVIGFSKRNFEAFIEFAASEIYWRMVDEWRAGRRQWRDFRESEGLS